MPTRAAQLLPVSVSVSVSEHKVSVSVLEHKVAVAVKVSVSV